MSMSLWPILLIAGIVIVVLMFYFRIKLSYMMSIAGIVAGVFLIVAGWDDFATLYSGTSLVCTGMVTLTIIETFKKP